MYLVFIGFQNFLIMIDKAYVLQIQKWTKTFSKYRNAMRCLSLNLKKNTKFFYVVCYVFNLL